MRIGVDIDGVVLDFVGAFLGLVREHYGTLLSHEDVFCHDLGQVLGLPKDMTLELVEETLRAGEFSPISGAPEALQSLIHQGHEITYITSRPNHHLDKTRAALIRNRIPCEEILSVNFLNKHEHATGLGLLVEDSIEEAVKLGHSGLPVLLYSQPWNRGSRNVKGYFTRVSDWPEILGHLKRSQAG